MTVKFDKNLPPEYFIRRRQDSMSLGRFFGSAESAPVYVGGAIVGLLVLSGILMLFFGQEMPSMASKDYWETIVPLITLLMGYLFGKGLK